MTGWARTLGFAMVSGTVASITSAASLGLLARAEGKGALQPVNATSHWLEGDKAALFTGADVTRTVVGYATHYTAMLFWAVLFEWWIGPRRPLAVLPVLERALATSAVAAAVDYGATAERFTPGWELVLSRRSMAAAYAAMAAGLAAGALMTQRRRPREAA